MTLQVFPGPEPGPGVDVPDLETVVRATSSFDADAPWTVIAPNVRPVFERKRPFPAPMPDPVTVVLPPGVSVGLGVNLGPAFVRVSHELLEGWGVKAAEAMRAGVDNVRRLSLRRGLRRQLVHEPVGDVPTVSFSSGDGWASTLLLVPDVLERTFGPADRFFVAPMRDLLIGLPPGVDRRFALWLSEEFEALDPNALALEGFLWLDGSLETVPIRTVAGAA